MKKVLFVITLLAFALLLIDSFKGPGTSARHFFVDGKLLSAVILLLLSFSISFKSRINLVILIISSVVYLFFVYTEALHFPNYVLSIYKIHLDGLVFIPLFSLSLLIVEKCKKEFTNISFVKFKDYFFGLIITLIIYFSFWNLGESLNTALNKNFYIFLHINNSYSDKMRFEWGNFYDFMSFVKNNTPENAQIVIPPEIEPWLAGTGDIKLVRGFLYPRTIIQYKDRDIPDIKSLEKGTFLLISWGDRDCGYPNCHGWPNHEINAQKILYKDNYGLIKI